LTESAVPTAARDYGAVREGEVLVSDGDAAFWLHLAGHGGRRRIHDQEEIARTAVDGILARLAGHSYSVGDVTASHGLVIRGLSIIS
jgi:hypothetical protein